MFFLAFRHLLSRKKQTILTLAGIILGTCAYVAISGMMMGFQEFIVDQLVNNDAQVRISAREENIDQTEMSEAFFGDQHFVDWIKPPAGRKDNPYILYPRGWIDRLESDERVTGISPQLVLQSIVTAGKVTRSARLVGIEPSKQLAVTNISKYMTKGKFTDIGTSGNRVVVGEGMLKNLGASVYETILISSGKGAEQPFKIVGSFRLGVKSLDETLLYGSLTDIQKLNQTPSRISEIAVRLRDVQEAGGVAQTWSLLSQEKVQSWDQANEGIMSVFKTQDIVRNAMTVSILVVASFGIYNILSLAVNHKRREIAILRSMGFEPKDIVKLFLIQGIALGTIGGFIGCVLGFIACRIMGTIEVSADRGLGGSHMMISYNLMIYVRGFFLAFFSSTFAGSIPATSAGRLEPIDIIRSEA